MENRPTFRDFLTQLQGFSDEQLDCPVNIIANECPNPELLDFNPAYPFMGNISLVLSKGNICQEDSSWAGSSLAIVFDMGEIMEETGETEDKIGYSEIILKSNMPYIRLSKDK